jgi:hypothetical protein
MNTKSPRTRSVALVLVLILAGGVTIFTGNLRAWTSGDLVHPEPSKTTMIVAWGDEPLWLYRSPEVLELGEPSTSKHRLQPPGDVAFIPLDHTEVEDLVEDLLASGARFTEYGMPLPQPPTLTEANLTDPPTTDSYVRLDLFHVSASDSPPGILRQLSNHWEGSYVENALISPWQLDTTPGSYLVCTTVHDNLIDCGIISVTQSTRMTFDTSPRVAFDARSEDSSGFVRGVLLEQ